MPKIIGSYMNVAKVLPKVTKNLFSEMLKQLNKQKCSKKGLKRLSRKRRPAAALSATAAPLACGRGFCIITPMIALFRRLLALFCATALAASQSAALAHAMAESPYEGEYIADVAEFSTVTVLSKDTLGSGFFIDNRLFITNHHMVDGGKGAVRFYTQIPHEEGWSVKWTAGKGVIVAVDRQNDLALVLTEKSYDYPLKVEKTSAQPQNTNVIIVGPLPKGARQLFLIFYI